MLLYTGQGSSGSRVYSAMNVTLGELNAVCEWNLSAGDKQILAATTTSNQQHDLQGRLLKQVASLYVCLYASNYYTVKLCI